MKCKEILGELKMIIGISEITRFYRRIEFISEK